MDKQNEFKDILVKIKATFLLREVLIPVFATIVILSKLTGTLFHTVNVVFLIIVLFIWFLTGFLFRFLISKQKTASSVGNLYFGYITLIEFPLLTAIIYNIGAVEWMGSIFFLFPIVFSGIIFPRKKVILICTAAGIYYLLIVILMHFNIIPFEYTFIKDFSSQEMRNYIINSIFFVIPVFYGIGLSANLFSEILTKKTIELEDIKDSLEEERGFLEVRVSARTKELEEMAKSLEGRVEERTKEIKEKMDELEKFHGLAVGREIKMVELKQRLKEAEEELEKMKEKQKS